jgi:hypothetical protein
LVETSIISGFPEDPAPSSCSTHHQISLRLGEGVSPIPKRSTTQSGGLTSWKAHNTTCHANLATPQPKNKCVIFSS